MDVLTVGSHHAGHAATRDQPGFVKQAGMHHQQTSQEVTHPPVSRIMPSIVLYYYHGSPWGAKVATYLNLRGIEYTECHQPIGWPRPDLEALNIRYRRIPLLAIGKDIYYDTSLILAKLETLYPDNRLGATASQPTEQALETLIEKWAAPIFPLAFHLLPTDMPLLKDSALVKDRTELWGQDFNPAGIEKGRTGSLVEMRENYAFLESLLQDGREWLLNSNTQKLGLADLHGIYAYFFYSLPFLSPPCLSLAGNGGFGLKLTETSRIST